MATHQRVAPAKFVMRGKETLVLVRAAQGGLMLHTMYFADEVRSFGELELARQLIDGLAAHDKKPLAKAKKPEAAPAPLKKAAAKR